jgi:hypothetical protein
MDKIDPKQAFAAKDTEVTERARHEEQRVPTFVLCDLCG